MGVLFCGPLRLSIEFSHFFLIAMPVSSYRWLRFTPAVLVGLLLGLSHPSRAQSGPVTPTVFDSVYTTQPVELVYMSAFLYDGGGQIHWITRQEHNSDHFQVEQSSDGQHWKPLAAMPAHPGYPEQYGYVYYDVNIRRYGVPIVYYRVRQVAKDGTYTYSPTRPVWLDKPAARLSSPMTGATPIK